jgi:shikimate kinase
MRIYVIGFMGSGKTFWGKKWASQLGFPFIDLDDLIVQSEGMSINEIFEKKGDAQFRLLEAEALRNTTNLETAIIACGGGTPCFGNNMDWMSENGKSIFIEATPDELLPNLRNKLTQRPLLKRMNTEKLKVYIEEKLEERNSYYLQAHHILPYHLLTIHSLDFLFN